MQAGDILQKVGDEFVKVGSTVVDTVRDELIKKLQWNSGGMSYGAAAVGNFFAALCSPRKTLPSSLVVSLPASDYTTEELEQLVQFSDDVTKQHIKSVGAVLASDNLVCIGKFGKGWGVKRVSWDHLMNMPTFDEVRQLILR